MFVSQIQEHKLQAIDFQPSMRKIYETQPFSET